MSYDYQTSLPAYNDAKISISKSRLKVLGAIQELGICNDKMIAEKLDWPINRITNRRGELLNEGKIILHKKAKDSSTNRTVNYWIATAPTVFQSDNYLCYDEETLGKGSRCKVECEICKNKVDKKYKI
jgi:hypothetical protein